MRISDDRYKLLSECMMDAFVSANMAGKITQFNEAFRAMLGYEREELFRLTYFDLTPEKWHALEKEIIKSQVLIHGHSEIYEKEYRRKDGIIFPVELRTTLIRDDDGHPQAMWAIIRDITERQRAFQSLQDSEERYRTLFQELCDLKQQLEAENVYLRAEIRNLPVPGQLIGTSVALRQVFVQVEQLAATDITVLIQGETGTGKELIAQYLHEHSNRNQRHLLKLSCAAIPATLMESELFGHEKGSFTGATDQRIGYFELADKGTIFLDEIGELPFEAQVKLLRVLQEGEFCRVGNPKPHKTDVRIIAATNRDLAEEVRQGRFREDLYYRLSVFPVTVPPLRERSEDIPQLVSAFIHELSAKMGKNIHKISAQGMAALQQYSWPGNVRELRNVIEHALIFSKGETLQISLPAPSRPGNHKSLSLQDLEYQHISEVLRSTNWRVHGPKGAARLLGLHPNTLHSRMKKLGIPSPSNITIYRNNNDIS